MKVLYDIDMDFFYDSERPLAEQHDKKMLISPSQLFRRCAGVRSFLHAEHHEALTAWDDSGLRGWECWHFDAHADMGDSAQDQPIRLPLGKRADHIHSGNFLLTALREGIVSRVHWVVPSWLSPVNMDTYLYHVEEGLRELITCHVWDDALLQLPDAQRVDISFSPEFTPLNALEHIPDFFSLDAAGQEDFVEKLLTNKARSLNALSPPSHFLQDRTPYLQGALLFHGSPRSDLTRLEGRPLFLSPSPSVAVCFSLPLRAEQGWIHGVDHLSERMPQVYLAVPPSRVKYLDAPMTLYRTHCLASCRPIGSLHGFEYASDEPHTVFNSTRFSSTWEALERYGVQVGIRGEERIMPCLRQAAVSMRREVEKYLEMPLDAILALPALEPSLLFFFLGVIGMPVKDFDSLPPRWWQRLLDRVLLPMIAPLLLRPEDFHGLAHSRETARWAALIALSEGCSPISPMIAACLHDTAREDDMEGEEHARDGAMLAQAFFTLPPGSKLPLSSLAQCDIVQAIAGHAHPVTTNQPVAACLQDADRLRLSWADEPRYDLFSTRSGLEMTTKGPQYATNLQMLYDRLGDENESPLECKIELTDTCNLACSFCHQGFGNKKGKSVMNFTQYRMWLARLKDERISMLRLTGGEPLLVPDLARYLTTAKEDGFYVTLNTNALLLDSARLPEILSLVDCLKVSFPAPDEESMLACTMVSGVWERKLEAAISAAAYHVSVEFLTPMFPAAIAVWEAFVELLSQVPFIRWVPLRAEPSPGNPRPVSREDMLKLMVNIADLRRTEQWENLMLYLATPFCLLDSPQTAVELLHGRQGCGPLGSLVIDSHGQVMRCYSQRRPLDITDGFRAASMRAVIADFNSLPLLCRSCPVVCRCLGGCRCRQALAKGGFDYLARPAQAKLWQERPLDFLC